MRERTGVHTHGTCARRTPVAVPCAALCVGRPRHRSWGPVSSGVPRRCADGLRASTTPCGQGMPSRQHQPSPLPSPAKSDSFVLIRLFISNRTLDMATQCASMASAVRMAPAQARANAAARYAPACPSPYPLSSLLLPREERAACWHLSETSFGRTGPCHAPSARVRSRNTVLIEDTRARRRPGLVAHACARKHPSPAGCFSSMRALSRPRTSFPHAVWGEHPHNAALDPLDIRPSPSSVAALQIPLRIHGPGRMLSEVVRHQSASLSPTHTPSPAVP